MRVDDIGANLARGALDLPLEVAHQHALAKKGHGIDLCGGGAPVLDAVNRLAHQLAIGMLSRADDPCLQSHGPLEIDDVAAADAVAAQQGQRVVENV